MPTKGKSERLKRRKVDGRPRCGLCGKTGKLTKTECCGQWICDDENKYFIFSYAGNSCHRNHRRYTLCGYHHTEGHPGDWEDCPKCRKAFGTEIYVFYGTNEFNFRKLRNPPAYLPTRCARCGVIISMGYDAYSTKGNEYWCEKCTGKEMEGAFYPAKD